MAKILIVDDSTTVATMLARLFQREGHEVLVEHDAEPGLARAREHCPALVVLDRLLPSGNGIDLCAGLKADKTLESTIVLMLTGTKDEAIAKAAAVAGVDVLLTKDCGLAHVLEAAMELLEQKASSRAS